MTIGLSASISGTLNERTPFSYFALAIFGILPLLIAGILVYRFHREKMKYWQTFTVSKYREFDEQIGKRQLQLKKYQDLLSQ